MNKDTVLPLTFVPHDYADGEEWQKCQQTADWERVKPLMESHKAMLEVLVQILEEMLYPMDALIPRVESIIAKAEQLEKGHEVPM